MMKPMLAVVLVAASIAHASETSLVDRIKRVGSVCVEGEACAASSQAAANPAEASQTTDAEQTYNSYCAVCHAQGVAGAPKFRDAKAWSERLEKGQETVYANAINGINGMPAKGLCMTCSDADIRVAVDFMLPE